MRKSKWYTYISIGLIWLGVVGIVQAASPADMDVMKYISRSSMTPMAMQPPVDTGTLLFSDSPEYAGADGILYADKVAGNARLYFYHVNDNAYDRKIVAVAYNPSSKLVIAQVKNCQYAQPDTSYYKVGKELSTGYYKNAPAAGGVVIMPQDYALLSEALNTVTVHPAELFSGILDIHTSSPLVISSVIMPVEEDPISFMKQQVYLPSDRSKLRGTFRGKDRLLKTLIPYMTQIGTGYIKLGDNVFDRFLQGWDSMDRRHTDDRGNYGVDYTIQVQTEGEGNIHLYFNPQGGAYAGVAEIIYNKGTRKEHKKIVSLPEHTLSLGNKDMYAIQYVDTFPAGQEVTLHVMPPGAANLPVRFIFVPEKNYRQAVQAVAAQHTDTPGAEEMPGAAAEGPAYAAGNARIQQLLAEL